MKTETQIAQENVKNLTAIYGDKRDMGNCQSHKATCQRFLDFLEELQRYKFKCGFMESSELCDVFEDNELIKDKITDLKQAIKCYEDAGI